MLAGQTLDAESLPMKFCGISHCFRTEAGAHGRATRGLYRVHQFTKIEMFAFTLPEQSDAMLDQLRGLECRLFDGLGIPYPRGRYGHRRPRRPGLSQVRPRSLDARPRRVRRVRRSHQHQQLHRLPSPAAEHPLPIKGEKGTHFVHTLNGTAIAISRALIAILENYQQADGSILIPEVLRPLVGKERIRGHRPADAVPAATAPHRYLADKTGWGGRVG